MLHQTTTNPRRPILVWPNAIASEKMFRREQMTHQQNKPKWVTQRQHPQKAPKAAHKNEHRNICHGTLFRIVKVETSIQLAHQPLATHHRRSLLIVRHGSKPLKRRFVRVKERNSCSLR
jgi:hypothetical protein